MDANVICKNQIKKLNTINKNLKQSVFDIGKEMYVMNIEILATEDDESISTKPLRELSFEQLEKCLKEKMTKVQ